MTEDEARDIIKDIPVGAKLQLVKYNGDILDVVLVSPEISAIEKKTYDNIEVPALPPALIVRGGRWGSYRVDTSDIIKIARIG